MKLTSKRQPQRGEHPYMKFILSHEGELNKGDDGWTALHIAADYGHIDVTKHLISQGADVNKEQRDGWTALHIAAQNGHLEVTKHLISQGAEVNREQKQGWTVLHSAAQNGNLDVTKYLISQGADVNKGNDTGWTVLHSAAKNGHPDVTKHLITKGAVMNTGEVTGQTALHLAAEYGHIDITSYLISKGVEVNEEGKRGRTALHLTVQNGHLDVMKYLIDQGADVNKGDTTGWTALHSAVEEGHLYVIKYLISHGADVNKGDRTDWVALHSAVNSGHIHVIKYLLRQGACLNKGDNTGWTALHIAAVNGQHDITKCLISEGADVNIQHDTGRTALHFGAENGYLDITKYLIDQGAEVNRGDKTGFTALHLAAANGHLDVTMHLVDQRAEINKEDNDGHTSLSFAVQNSHVEISDEFYGGELAPDKALVFYLLDNGARIDVKDKSGRLPIHYAKDELVRQMILSRLNSLEDIRFYRVLLHKAENEAGSTASRVKVDENISQGILQEDLGLSMFIPPNALLQGESREITLTLLRDLPSVDMVYIQDDESVACYGIRCDPPNMVFLKPVKIRIPHATLVANPAAVKPDVVSYEWDSVNDLPRSSRSRSSNSPDKPPYCKVYERHLDLYIDHSAEWWVLIPLEQHVIKHRLICTPYIPDTITRGKEISVHLRLHVDIPGMDVEIQEEEKKQCYHKAHPSMPISIASKAGDVSVTSYRDGDAVDKKVLFLKEVQRRVQHCIVLSVPMHEDNTDLRVTVILTQSGKRVDVSVSLTFVIGCSDKFTLEPTPFGWLVEEVSKGDLQDVDILNIAEKMTVDQFYDLGVALGFTITQLDSIEYQRFRDRQQASYDMLIKWRQTQTSGQAAKEELITIMETLDSPTKDTCALETTSASEIPDKMLLDISRKIKPEKYFETGRKLGLTKVELEHMKHRTFANRRDTNIQMLSTWKRQWRHREKAVETLNLVWNSVQSVKKADNIEEEGEEGTSAVLKQVVVERAKQTDLESEHETMEIIEFSGADYPSSSSCKHEEIREDLDQHGGIPNKEELCSVARHVKSLQTARSLGKALHIDDISIIGFVTQLMPSLLRETAQQIVRMWHNGLQEGVKEDELNKLFKKYNISGDKIGGYEEIAQLIRFDADLQDLVRHLDVHPTNVMDIINTSTTLTSHMVVHVALQMLIEWSNKGGTRERLLAIAQAFHFSLADIAKGLACHSTYPFVITHGTIDRRGGKLTLDKLGIRPTVSIPEGAIPKGSGSTVTLRVSIRNTPRLPLRDDEVLVTPVIETSFTQELVKPATVVLPHCMGFNNDDSTIVMYTKTGPEKFGRRILTGDDFRISKSTLEFCTRHIEVLAVCSNGLQDLQLTCLVFQPTMKSPLEQPKLRVYIIHPYMTYVQDLIKKELESPVPYSQVGKEFKFSIGSTAKHLKIFCHEMKKHQKRMMPIKSILSGDQCSPLVFKLQFSPEENGEKNIRIAIHERHESLLERRFNIAIEDEPDFTTNHMDSEGQLSCLSNNVIGSLADVIVEPRDAYSFGRHIGFSDSAVEQYLNRPDSLSKTVSRSGFVDMLSDWRRRVQPSEQIGEIYHSLNLAGLSYVTDTILHGVAVSSKPNVAQRVRELESHKKKTTAPFT